MQIIPLLDDPQSCFSRHFQNTGEFIYFGPTYLKERENTWNCGLLNRT